MYADISFQDVKFRNVTTYDDLDSTPIMINFDSEQNSPSHYSRGLVCFHLHNAALARDLVEAINAVLTAHRNKADLALLSLTEKDFSHAD